MTIVAGFVHENGVLICSDTLLANSTNAKYGAKIFPVLFNDGRALIGFSGPEVFAQGAIEQIQRSLSTHTGSPRAMSEIVEHARRNWFRAYKKIHPKSTEYLSGEQIVAAFWSAKEARVVLYRSSGESFSESPEHAECIGAGDVLGQYLIGSSAAGPSHNEREIFERAVQVLASVKAYMPQSVGGRLVAATLTHKGEAKVYGCQEITYLEGYANLINIALREFACGSLRGLRDGAFGDETLAEFDRHIRCLRQAWNDEGWCRTFSDSPAAEAENILRAFSQAAQ
jgi:hypothetical protein